jgi:hypothetical protein
MINTVAVQTQHKMHMQFNRNIPALSVLKSVPLSSDKPELLGKVGILGRSGGVKNDGVMGRLRLTGSDVLGLTGDSSGTYVSASSRSSAQNRRFSSSSSACFLSLSS